MHGVLLGFGGAHDLFGQPSRFILSNFWIHLSVWTLEIPNSFVCITRKPVSVMTYA